MSSIMGTIGSAVVVDGPPVSSGLTRFEEFTERHPGETAAWRGAVDPPR